MEILHNDGEDYIVGSDVMARPIAGEIAQTAIDTFSFQQIKPGSAADASGPYSNGAQAPTSSPLLLRRERVRGQPDGALDF
jgi:hypothetical protein